jgi:hypothetical protein
MASLAALSAGKAFSQHRTQTLAPAAGINKSLADESNGGLANDGRDDFSTPLFLIGRDPFLRNQARAPVVSEKVQPESGLEPRVNDRQAI